MRLASSEAKDASKLPVMHRTAPQQRITWSKTSIVPRLRNRALVLVTILSPLEHCIDLPSGSSASSLNSLQAITRRVTRLDF